MIYSRQPLGFFPTPLHELKRLGAHMQGPRIYIKRDDCSGLGLGGNKVRKLEYILADAQEKGADVIITTGAVSSNHARQTAAAAALLGIECRLVLAGREPEIPQGNYLLDDILGAKCKCVRMEDVDKAIAKEISSLKASGKTPYYIPAGGHTVFGTLAYMEAYREIVKQADFSIDAIISAVGTGTTYAGLHLGSLLDKNRRQIIGVSVGGDSSWCTHEILDIVNQTETFMGIESSGTAGIDIRDQYVGDGYTRVYPELRETIELLARLEGIFLDPVYTGKAMTGLLDMISRGEFSSTDRVVFLHTGGAPELFSYNQFMSDRE